MSDPGAPACHIGRPRISRAGPAFVAWLGLAALHAHAQNEPTATNRQFSIVPSLSVSETLTDNATLSSAKRYDAVTQITPSLQITSNGGRVRGFANYSLSEVVYARGTDSNRFQQSLNAVVKAEAIENFAFVDANASISQQNISAIGTPAPDTTLQSANQTEVRSVYLSPYAHGRLGSALGYEARLNYSTTHSGSDAIGNSTNTGGSLHLGSDGAFARLNWALDGSRHETDFTEGRKTRADVAVAALLFNATPDLQFSARGGREINNVVTLERQGSTTYGGGLRWAPSERTNLSVQGDKRYFGNSYAFKFEHRTAQTVWTLTDTRDVNTDAADAARRPLFTEFDLVYLQLASKYPDPLERAKQAFAEVLRLGKNPLALAPNGFLSNAVSLQRSQGVSFAYLGLRSTLVLSAQQSDTRRLDPVSSAVDSLSSGTSIRLRSLVAAASHRLTPLSTVSLSVNQARSRDTITGTQIDLLTVTASVSSQVNARTLVSLGARRAISDGGSSNYNESALLATLLLQF